MNNVKRLVAGVLVGSILALGVYYAVTALTKKTH